MNILEVKNLSKRFKGFSLENISFNLPKGYIMGYVGQNGAGKTTTLNLITNLLKRDTGEIRINGISYEKNLIEYKESIGFIGDEFFFPKEFYLKDIRNILKNFYKSFNEKEFNRMISTWNLPENKKLGEYSRGMKIKLMFADVLSRDTKLLILDEATNGLDPVVRDDVLTLLQEYIADGERSVLFSTHILSDLEQIADYICFIDNGKMIINDAKDNILENYILVKGDKADITGTLKKEFIGIMKNEFGFEALIPSDKSVYLSNKYVLEKPTIDQIVIHHIRNKI